MELSKLLPPELLWLLPLAGVITLLWGHVRALWASVGGLLVGRLVLREWHVVSIRNTLLDGAWNLPGGGLNLFRRAVFVAGRHDTQVVGVETGDVVGRFFLWHGSPVILRTDKSGRATLHYVRGWLNQNKFIECLVEAERKATQAVCNHATEFSVRRCTGDRLSNQPPRLQRRPRHESGSMSSEPPTDPSGSMDTALWESSNWAHPARYRHTRIIGVTEKIAEYRQQEKPETQILTSVVEEMLDDARKWWAAGDWYARKGVDWRRGYLLYGPPGNGKTTAAVALARELRLPVYVPDLSTYTNEEFASWIDGFSNCIFLIEDIHLCYDGTQSLMGEGSLTFDCLLNCLGGAIPLSGVLVLITTNDPSKMDPALSGIHDGRTSRPGRVDRSFKFDNPTAAEREALIQSFQLSAADTQVLLERTKGDLSVAQVREQCIQLAIQRHWDMTLTNAKASLNNVRDIRTTTP